MLLKILYYSIALSIKYNVYYLTVCKKNNSELISVLVYLKNNFDNRVNKIT